MGCGPSKSDLSVVQEVTGMTKKDAKESFDGFKKQAGGSKIKLDKFTKLVSSLNTNKGKETASPIAIFMEIKIMVIFDLVTKFWQKIVFKSVDAKEAIFVHLLSCRPHMFML